MRKLRQLAGAVLMLAFLSATMISCKDDPDPLVLQTLLANGIDLNGAQSATGVPSDAVITATFNTDVNSSTANTSNITMVNTVDGSSVPLTISTSGSQVTITPDPMGTGTLYNLTFGAGLESSDGGSFTATSRSFTTEGTYAPSDAKAYWSFDDGTANATIGGYTPSEVTDATFVDSHNSISGKAIEFDGTSTYVEFAGIGPELMNTASFTLSFWVYVNSVDHVDAAGNPKGHFITGTGFFRGFQFEVAPDYGSCKLAASYHLDTIVGSEDLWFAGDGNLGWQGWTFCADLTGSGGVAALLKDTWANVVCTYDADSKEGTMYINGVMMKQQDFDLWPSDSPKFGCIGLMFDPNATDVGHGFVLGFGADKSTLLFSTEPWGDVDSPYSNHFRGKLDDLRIYHRALTEDEIFAMYNSSK